MSSSAVVGGSAPGVLVNGGSKNVDDDDRREKRDHIKAVVNDLLKTAQSVWPLKLLCRVCIRQHCQFFSSSLFSNLSFESRSVEPDMLEVHV